MADYHQISTFEKEQLLHFLAYNLTMEQRHKLMEQLPQAYNHLISAEVVRVVRMDGSDV